MMLDALSIGLGSGGRYAQCFQQPDNDVMAVARFMGEMASCCRKKDRSIWLGGDESLTLQPLYFLIRRHVCDADAPRKGREPGLAALLNQLSDHLDIILGQLLLVILAGTCRMPSHGHADGASSRRSSRHRGFQ